MKSFAIAIVTALGSLLATVPVANAQNAFQCNTGPFSTISNGSTINSSLVVPAYATCFLSNVTVVGNVHVGMGATLGVFPSERQTVTIDGNIVADQCEFIELATSGGVISVEGNVTIQYCTDGGGYGGPNVTISGNFVCANNPNACFAQGGVVQGNLTVDNNNNNNVGNIVDVEGNQVSGNVDVSGNSGQTPIVGGNTIGGNLRCSGNSATLVDEGFPNIVSGSKLGQCAGL